MNLIVCILHTEVGSALLLSRDMIVDRGAAEIYPETIMKLPTEVCVLLYLQPNVLKIKTKKSFMTTTFKFDVF